MFYTRQHMYCETFFGALEIGKSHNYEFSSCQYGMLESVGNYDVTMFILLIFCMFIILNAVTYGNILLVVCMLSICILKNELFKITFSQEKQSSACSIVYSFRCLDTFDISLLRQTEVILGVSPYTNVAFRSKNNNIAPTYNLQ